MQKSKRPSLGKGCLSKEELRVIIGGINGCANADPPSGGGNGNHALTCFIESCTACTACENCIALCTSVCAICSPGKAK